MNRREFIAVSAMAGLTLAGSSSLKAADPAAKQILELRLYTFKNLDQQKAYDEFLAKVEIPTLNGLGIKPVGVFKMLKADNDKLLKEDSPSLYVLLPYPSAELLLSLPQKLAADEQYQKAGESVIKSATKTPAFQRYESQLLLAFDQCPNVETPTTAPGRLMQLRIYESHNPDRAKMKIHMFNEGGEIALFRKTGLNPVFFGQSIAGTKLPNLTYMVAFDNKAAQDKAWATFGAHPDWKKMSSDPIYKDTVSNITNLVLRPAESSQI